MILKNGKFTEAYYTDSKRNVIETVWEYNDGKKIGIAIPADLDNKNYILLMEQYTVDEIATMTNELALQRGRDFIDLVIAISQEAGYIVDKDKIEGKPTHSVENIFNPPEGEEGDDFLFETKLKIFELDAVTKSENDSLKKELREADSPLKALYIAGKFMFEKEKKPRRKKATKSKQ